MELHLAGTLQPFTTEPLPSSAVHAEDPGPQASRSRQSIAWKVIQEVRNGRLFSRLGLKSGDVAASLEPALDRTASAVVAGSLLSTCVCKLLRWRASSKNAHEAFLQKRSQKQCPETSIKADQKPARHSTACSAGLFSLDVARLFRASIGEPKSLAQLATALGGQDQDCQTDAPPDNVELRLGYGAMLSGKVGTGDHAFSLRTLLGQAAEACALCTVAIACIKVLFNQWQDAGWPAVSGSVDEAEACSEELGSTWSCLMQVCKAQLAMWAELCHAMMQPLQGAVEVQAALHCSMSDDFISTAAEEYDMGGEAPVNQVRFIAELLVKLGFVQLKIIHDLRGCEEAPPSGGAEARDTVPLGLNHFIQANRMRMNCVNAIDRGLFSRERSQSARQRKKRRRKSSSWCPTTGKIFQCDGPQQPLALPCCGAAISSEGLVRVTAGGTLQHMTRRSCPCCSDESVLPADLRKYQVHAEEFEAACCADLVELESFDKHRLAAVEASREEVGGQCKRETAVQARALGRDMYWESRRIADFVERVPLPGTPVSKLKDVDWYHCLQLHDLAADSFMSTFIDPGLDKALEELLSTTYAERLCALDWPQRISVPATDSPEWDQNPPMHNPATSPASSLSGDQTASPGGARVEALPSGTTELSPVGKPGAPPTQASLHHEAAPDATNDEAAEVTVELWTPSKVAVAAVPRVPPGMISLAGESATPAAPEAAADCPADNGAVAPATSGSAAHSPVAAPVGAGEAEGTTAASPAAPSQRLPAPERLVRQTARTWACHTRGRGVRAEDVAAYLTARDAPTVLPAGTAEGARRSSFSGADFLDWRFVGTIHRGLMDLRQVQQGTVAGFLLGSQGSIADLGGLRMHGYMWPSPTLPMLPGDRTVVFSMLSLLEDSGELEPEHKPEHKPGRDIELVAMMLFAQRPDYHSRLRLHGDPAQRDLWSFLPRVYDFGDGDEDLEDDEQRLLRYRASNDDTALLKRPFIVMQLGQSLSQWCEVELADSRFVVEQAGRVSGPHVPEGQVKLEEISEHASPRLARLTAVRAVLQGAARCIAGLHARGFEHRSITPEHLLYFRHEDTWKFSNLSNVCCAGMTVPAKIHSMAYASPEDVRAAGEGERESEGVATGWAADAWAFGVIAISLLCSGAPESLLLGDPKAKDKLLGGPGEVLPWEEEDKHAELWSSGVGRAALRLVARDKSARWSVQRFLDELESVPECSQPATVAASSRPRSDAVPETPPTQPDHTTASNQTCALTVDPGLRTDRNQAAAPHVHVHDGRGHTGQQPGGDAGAVSETTDAASRRRKHPLKRFFIRITACARPSGAASTHPRELVRSAEYTIPTLPRFTDVDLTEDHLGELRDLKHAQGPASGLHAASDDASTLHVSSDHCSKASTSFGSTYTGMRSLSYTTRALSGSLQELLLEVTANEDSPFTFMPELGAVPAVHCWQTGTAPRAVPQGLPPDASAAASSSAAVGSTVSLWSAPAESLHAATAGSHKSSTSHTTVFEPHQNTRTAGRSGAEAPQVKQATAAWIETMDALKTILEDMDANGCAFLDRYEILWGQHGRDTRHSFVQFARDARSGDEVAIKFFMDTADFTRESAAFDSAGQAMPATLTVQDSFDFPQARNPRFSFPPCVVMEKGQTLRDWSSSEARDLHSMLTALADVIRALHQLHCAGIVHRDVKPNKILRRPKVHACQWALIDYGCAARAGTEAEVELLSPKYCAPEVMAAHYRHKKGVQVDPAMDIWALGIVALELITGEPAYPTGRVPSQQADTLVQRAMLGKAPLPWEALTDRARQRLDAAHGLKAAVLRCLEREARLRPSAGALLAEWHEVVRVHTQPGLSIASQSTVSAGRTGPA